MTLELVTIPCLSDNYAYLLHNSQSGETTLIDAPEAAPIIAALEDRNWTLSEILITHHHHDHITGVEELRSRYGSRVAGASRDAHRLPALDLALSDGDTFSSCGEQVQVLGVDGHTVGHIAFYYPRSGYLFSGDSLMSAGCGRLFEGSPEQMWASLSKLRALPDTTQVCSGHEYTLSNLKFALSIDDKNPETLARVQRVTALRSENRPSVPVSLATEKATNPFLRCDSAEIKIAVGMENASDVEVFAEVRSRKDNF